MYICPNDICAIFVWGTPALSFFCCFPTLPKFEALLFLCNYTAHSLIKSDITKAMFSMIGHLLGSEFGPQSCGLLRNALISKSDATVHYRCQKSWQLGLNCSAWLLKAAVGEDLWGIHVDPYENGNLIDLIY
jgi:hypothetical protein